VLALGAKQLFLGEVQTGQSRFSALYGFLAREVRGRERGAIAVCVLHMQTRLSSLIPNIRPRPASMHLKTDSRGRCLSDDRIALPPNRCVLLAKALPG
jgi:hypothetical protein